MTKAFLLTVFLGTVLLSVAQTGTIKVKKSVSDTFPAFNFRLFDRCISQPLDSAIRWISVYGFKEGELLNKTYSNTCGDPNVPVQPRTKLFCRYFCNGSIDLILTYTRKKKIYMMMIVVIDSDHSLGEDLSAGSLVDGYKFNNDSKKWRKITENGSRLSVFSFDKGVWSFNLKDRSMVKK